MDVGGRPDRATIRGIEIAFLGGEKSTTPNLKYFWCSRFYWTLVERGHFKYVRYALMDGTWGRPVSTSLLHHILHQRQTQRFLSIKLNLLKQNSTFQGF